MFPDRRAAATQLVLQLKRYLETDALVLGLARGGVVVAKAVARALQLPLDVVVIKKISPPLNPELAIGAVAPDGVRIIDYAFAKKLGVDESYLRQETNRKFALAKQKMQLYRKGKPPLAVAGKTVIIVDDGAATGATVQAAVAWAKQKHANRIVLALPVAPRDVIEKIKPEVDELIVLSAPENFSAVGQFYQHFDQVEDNDVIQLLV